MTPDIKHLVRFQGNNLLHKQKEIDVLTRIVLENKKDEQDNPSMHFESYVYRGYSFYRASWAARKHYYADRTRPTHP